MKLCDFLVRIAPLAAVFFLTGCPGGGNQGDICCPATAGEGSADPNNMPPPATTSFAALEVQNGEVEVALYRLAFDPSGGCARQPCYTGLLEGPFGEPVLATAADDYAWSLEVPRSLVGDPTVVFRARGYRTDGTEVEAFALPVQPIAQDDPIILPPFDYQTTVEGIAERQAMRDWSQDASVVTDDDGPPNRSLIRRSIKLFTLTKDSETLLGFDFKDPTQMSGWGRAALESQYGRYFAYWDFWGSARNPANTDPFAPRWQEVKDVSRSALEAVDKLGQAANEDNDLTFESTIIQSIDDIPNFAGWRARSEAENLEQVAVLAFVNNLGDGLVSTSGYSPPGKVVAAEQYLRILAQHQEAHTAIRAFLEPKLSTGQVYDDPNQAAVTAMNRFYAMIENPSNPTSNPDNVWINYKNNVLASMANDIDRLDRQACGSGAGQGGDGAAFQAIFNGPGPVNDAKVALRTALNSGQTSADNLSTLSTNLLSTSYTYTIGTLQDGLGAECAEAAAYTGYMALVNEP